MKRLVLVAVLLLGGGLAAHADVAHYTNLLKQPRGERRAGTPTANIATSGSAAT